MAIPQVQIDAMFAAVDAGDAEAIRTLIRNRVDIVDAQRPDGLSVLLHAMYLGKWELVDIIAPIHPGLDVFESAALGRASRIKHLTTTNILLLGKRTPDGWTALHLAAFFGQIEAARMLIDKGADVNARSENEMANCPLHSAAAGDHYMVCELLIANGGRCERDPGGRPYGADGSGHARGPGPLRTAPAARREQDDEVGGGQVGGGTGGGGRP